MFRFKPVFAFVLTASFALAAPVSAQTPPNAGSAPAQSASGQAAPQTVGRYTVSLRLLKGGVFAGEETDLYVHLSDTGRPDPKLGPLGVARAQMSGEISGSAKSGAKKPAIYEADVPGDYRLVTTFEQGGAYTLALIIKPPAGGSELIHVSFPVLVGEARPSKARKEVSLPYTLDAQTAPYRVGAGENAQITVLVKSRDSKKSVTDFDEISTLPLHLFLIKDDLSAFYHEVPQTNKENEYEVPFVLPFSFPSAGQWRVWADVAPRDAGEMLLPGKIEINGVRPLPVRLGQPTTGTVRSSDGSVLATLKTNRLTAGTLQSFVVGLTDARGGDVSDLQPYLGSLAHFAAAHERDANAFVVARADETDPRSGRGGTVSFLVRFPKSGLYKVWLQFQRTGTTSTVPLVVRVSDK